MINNPTDIPIDEILFEKYLTMIGHGRQFIEKNLHPYKHQFNTIQSKPCIKMQPSKR
jgi:hypothetical protein